MNPRQSRRQVAANLALGAGVLALAWSLWLALAGGFDTRLFGIRIRSNDALRTAIYAVIAFALYALLRVGPANRAGGQAWTSNVRAALPLVLLLIAAAVVRLWGITFGLPHLFCRPDEDAVISIATTIFHGGMNPGYFSYPPLFMLTIAGTLRVVEVTQRALAVIDIRPDFVVAASVTKYMVARLLSAAAGVATVALVHRTGTRLFSPRAGLAGAGCLALAFLHVRDSHFGVTDVPMTFMVALAFLWVVRLSASGSTRDLVGAALIAGLGVATKYNAALVAVPAAFALLADPVGRPLSARLTRVGLFGIVMVGAFLAVAPFSVVEYQQFFHELRGVSEHLSGGHGVNLGRGWIYHLTTTLRYGLGLPLLLSGIGGLLLLLYRQPRAGTLVALFPLAYYAVGGSGFTVFTRHMQPLVPFLCLTAGYALIEAAEWFARAIRRPAWTPGVALLAGIIVLSPSAYSVFKFDQFIARTDNRLLARRWIEARFPAGTTIAQPGPGSGRVFTFTPEEIGYVSRELTSRGPQPDLVIVQSSPLQGLDTVYHDSAILADAYDLRLALTVAADDAANVYDRQDDFYLPMSGFKRIERPGPNLRIYVRRGPR